jgi:cytochrome c553
LAARCDLVGTDNAGQSSAMVDRSTPCIGRRAAKRLVLTLVAGLASAPAGAQGDKALGEYLSSECVTCHQLSGRYQGIPPIVGWPEQSFVEIMDEYRSKKRNNPVMQTIAAKFSKEEIAALAAYFGSVKPKN